jgi:hypothetical protein
LKRRLSDVVFRHLVADQRATIGACESVTTAGRTPSTSTSPITPGRETIPLDPPEGKQAHLFTDWKDGKIVGLEILDATDHLHRDFLDQAEIIG